MTVQEIRDCEECGPEYACEEHKELWAELWDSAFG
jgi:hypothetical protein